MTPDTEITLTQHGFQLTVSPYGASLRGLSHKGDAVITGYTGAANKAGGQGDVLIPFPGRIAGGQYTFDGKTYQMERNDKDGPNAIHGFLRSLLWQQETLTETSVTFAAEIQAAEYAAKGYPFSLRAEVTYQVTDDGMACTFTLTNIGENTAPVAAGFHPYFTVGSEWIDTDQLQVPFESTLEFDDNLIPTGRVLPVQDTPLDFRQSHLIGTVQLNTCYLHPTRDADGLLRIRLHSSETERSVTVILDPTFDYVVLYSGDPLPDSHRRRALAIEPMTCASDAFNHPEWGLVHLEHGKKLTGTWRVSVGSS